jgi:hypothetical protein
MDEIYIKNAENCGYVWIASHMMYCFDILNSHWKDRMIRLAKFLVNNIINIDNNVWYLTSYLFV